MRMILVLIGGWTAGAILYAGPPSAISSKALVDESPTHLPLTGLKCPSCRTDGKLIPIKYGLPRGRPKPTVADGVTCPPFRFYAGGCLFRGDVWHCDACGEEFRYLPKKDRQDAAKNCSEVLRHGPTCDRRSAVQLLIRTGLRGTEAIPAVLGALTDTDSIVRSKAARALGWRLPLSEDVLPALVTALFDRSAGVRASAAHAISKHWEIPKSIRPQLLRALTDDDAIVRARIAKLTGRIGVYTDGAVTALERLLNDADDKVRAAARESLQRIQAERRQSPTPASK